VVAVMAVEIDIHKRWLWVKGVLVNPGVVGYLPMIGLEQVVLAYSAVVA